MSTKLRNCLCGCVLALSLASPAYPWWSDGHKAIAMVAEQNLTPEVRSRVVQILGSESLPSIASWMDEVRSAVYHQGPLASDPEVLRFVTEFRNNSEWHYVDLPFGSTAYTLDGPFTKPDDVVHSIEEAVNVLEGGGNHKITKRQALCMLVHFIGDEAQPLHVVNGYYKVNADGGVTLVTDPAAAVGLPSDKGGNALIFGPNKNENLHAYWDGLVVEKLTKGKGVDVLAADLETKVAAEGKGWKSSGDYHHWPEAWATESLAASQTVFKGLVFGAETPDKRGGIKSISITLPADYDVACVPLAEERLAKAGYHLAEILNAVQWAQ